VHAAHAVVRSAALAVQRQAKRQLQHLAKRAQGFVGPPQQEQHVTLVV
jgi:hypothetical protein